MRRIALSLAGVLILLMGGAAGQPVDRRDMVEALLKRSRLMEDVQVRVPTKLYRQYLEETGRDDGALADAPVSHIAESGRYHLALDPEGGPALTATIAFHVFSPRLCRNLPVLSAAWAWEEVKVNGDPARLAVKGGWFLFTPSKPGRYVITGRVAMKKGDRDGGKLTLEVPATVGTFLKFDSPKRRDVTVQGAPRRLAGDAKAGTHGELALSPRSRIVAEYARSVDAPSRPARYELSGAIAWNIDAGRQQIASRVRVGILGGRTDRLNLTLPARAARVEIAGPDVREAQISAGGAAVFLKGGIGGQTRLSIAYELPLDTGSVQRMVRPEVEDGHWSGGTVIVTNTAGGNEILEHSAGGLREMHPEDLSPEARSILAGKPVLAYEIEARRVSMAVDVVGLGEFAFRESIADLAHYQLTFRPDGTILCKVDYEIRNRSRQFLRLHLPPDSVALVARVNDKPQPLASAKDGSGAWLLPLVRSQASIKGLVSFPVQVVTVYRGQALEKGGQASLPLPRIDLPIAYGWCELHVPRGMNVQRWAGPMRQVKQYSSETAVASLAYGSGELAEGYKPADRPTVVEAKPKPKPRPKGEPTPEEKPVSAPEPSPAPLAPVKRAPPQTPAAPAGKMAADPAQPAPVEAVPDGSTVVLGGQTLLARNYYRAGRDYYERGQYDQAAVSLGNTLRFDPQSAEAANAERLLSNIKVLRGELDAKSRQEKTLSRQVRQETSGLNVKLEHEQEELIAKGKEAIRKGSADEALASFQAAQSLGTQLRAQGADERQQTRRLGEVSEQLAGLAEQQKAGAAKLREQYKTYKDRGDYEAALQLGKRLQGIDRDRDDGLRRELEDLAVKTVSERAQRAPDLPAVQKKSRSELGYATFAGSGTLTVAKNEWKSEDGDSLEGPKTGTGEGQYAGGWRKLPVTHADPKAVAEALGQVLDTPGGGTGRGGGRFGPSHLADAKPGVEVQSGAGEIVVRADDATFEKIRALTGELDKAQSSSGRAVATYSLSHANARDVASRLSDVAGLAGEDKASRPDVAAHVAVDETTNSPIVSAPPAEGERLGKLIRGLDAAGESGVVMGPRWVTRTGQETGAVSAEARPVTKERISSELPWYENLRYSGDAKRPDDGRKGDATARADGPQTGPDRRDRPEDETRRRKRELVTHSYDIRDLIATNFEDNGPEGTVGGQNERKQATERIAETLNKTLSSNLAATGGSLEIANGRLIVTAEKDGQELAGDLIEKLRDVRGPQVEVGGNIARQRAGKLIVTADDMGDNFLDDIQVGFSTRDGEKGPVARRPAAEDRNKQLAEQPEFQDFLRRNYSWQVDRSAGDGDWSFDQAEANWSKRLQPPDRGGEEGRPGAPVLSNIPTTGRLFTNGAKAAEDLVGTLDRNWGQKVVVNSINVNVDSASANQLGIRFSKGVNDIDFAVVDEAQLRTLRDMEARRSGRGRRVEANPRFQETIVSTDALLASGQTANVAFAGDRGNTIDIAGNPVRLAHEKYVLIDNDGYLTAVQAGEMQHWTQQAKPVEFAEVPQELDVPRVGRLVKLEKTLIKPTDELTIHATYTWKE